MTPTEIRQVRYFLGMSRAEFAAALGVQERTVVSWEYNERKPSGAVMKSIERLKGLEYMRQVVERAKPHQP